MIWKGIKTIFACVLMGPGILSVAGITAHFVVPGVTGPHISSSSSPWLKQGFTIDCTTWWGTLIHFLIALCVFAWGWGIIHDIKKEESQPPLSPTIDKHKKLL